MLKKTTDKSKFMNQYFDIVANDDIKFETKTHLFAFNDRVYNLDTDEWVSAEPTDYINITTGYDYREPTQEEIETVESLIEKILPDKEIRDYYMVLLSTGLYGETLQKFIIALGEGRNGKGCLNDFFKCFVGNYGYELNSKILMDPIKEGVNQEIANINNKRFTICREPDGKGVSNATVRQITGGSTITARGCYDKDTTKYVRHTLFMETNDWLEYNSKIKLADIDRLINIPFNSYFTAHDEEVDEANHKYKLVSAYTTDKFREQHKFALFHVMCGYNKLYKSVNKNLTKLEPESVRDLTKRYIINADKIINWCNNHLKPLTDDELKLEKPYVLVKDLLDIFKCDEIYNQLTKKEKRKDASFKGFCEYLQKSVLYKKAYFDRKKVHDKDVRTKMIYGYKTIVPTDDDDDDEVEEENEC